MHPNRSCLSERPCATAVREDGVVEAAVLMHVIALYPVQLTEDDLLRELVTDSDDFSERDGIERAVRDLASAGLLHRHDPFVLPTRAVLHAYELWEA